MYIELWTFSYREVNNIVDTKQAALNPFFVM